MRLIMQVYFRDEASKKTARLMKVAHVYMGFEKLTFKGYTILGVPENHPSMQNKVMLEEMLGFKEWAAEALYYGEHSQGDSYTDWIEVNCYHEPSEGDLQMLEWFQTDAINQWGKPQNPNRKTRFSFKGATMSCEQHFYIPFEYVDHAEYTEEMMLSDLRCVAKHDERIRNVIDIKHPFLTTVEAEYDRAMISMHTNSCASRLHATGNYPTEGA